MTLPPLDQILVDGVAPDKADHRAHAQARKLTVFNSISELKALASGTTALVYIRSVEREGRIYEYDATDGTSEGDDVLIVVTAGGQRFKLLGRLGRVREVLAANRTYYVDPTDGDDDNDGLSAGAGAFATFARAFDVICELDIGAYTVTVDVADDSYTEAISLSGPFNITTGNVKLSGNTTTPGNCTITTAASCISLSGGAKLQIQGVKLVSTGNYGLSVEGAGSEAAIVGNSEFGACSKAHITVFDYGRLVISSNYLISGGGTEHIRATNGGSWQAFTKTVTISGSPTFSVAFVRHQTCATCNTVGMTYSGAVTGTRYSATLNGVINTSGGGASYFPGTVAGSTSTGGQYG